MPSFSH